MRYVLPSKIYTVERKPVRTVNPEAIPAKEPAAPDLLGGIGELDSPRSLRLLRAAFWAIAILAGFLQAWAAAISVTMAKWTPAERPHFSRSAVLDGRRDIIARITHSGHK